MSEALAIHSRVGRMRPLPRAAARLLDVAGALGRVSRSLERANS